MNDQITDEMIQEALDKIVGASVEWTGHMPRNGAAYDYPAEQRDLALTVADVRRALRHDIMAETPEGAVRSAISIAAEPDDLPENAMVVVRYDG